MIDLRKSREIDFLGFFNLDDSLRIVVWVFWKRYVGFHGAGSEYFPHNKKYIEISQTEIKLCYDVQ